MCARSVSSRIKSCLSVMICITRNVVVYCDGFLDWLAAWTSRTVEGPRSQRTFKISNSASVGRDDVFRAVIVRATVYEDMCTCQYPTGAAVKFAERLADIPTRRSARAKLWN